MQTPMGPRLHTMRVLRDTEAEMSPRLTAAITVAIHELKRRPYSTIRNDTVAELEAALAAEKPETKSCDSCRHRLKESHEEPCILCFGDHGNWTAP